MKKEKEKLVGSEEGAAEKNKKGKLAVSNMAASEVKEKTQKTGERKIEKNNKNKNKNYINKENSTANKENSTADKENNTANKENSTADKEINTANKENSTANKENTTANKKNNTVDKEKKNINKVKNNIKTAKNKLATEVKDDNDEDDTNVAGTSKNASGKIKNKAVNKVVTKNPRREEINQKILDTAKKTPDELLEEAGITLGGLSEEQVEEALDKYGKNELTEKRKDSFLKRMAKAYIHPFTIVLMVLAIISLFMNVVFVPRGTEDPSTIIIISLMVILSGTLRFVQEAKSGKAAEKLKKLVGTTTAIMRDGETKEMPLHEVVVGDIICLSVGDMVPADVRIMRSKDLFISQSSLTGESDPQEKISSICKKKNPLELNNFAYMGTNVVSGSALGLVVAIGDDTIFGSMASAITDKKVVTSFEKGINSVSWVLIRFMLCMVPIIFFINGITKGVIYGGGGAAWLNALMFALAVAVGLTPEMLPMIVTTGLAKGAVAMSSKKVVVKNLNVIQNFGAMDVLCTDKTGTLTQDKVVLEYHFDIAGNENDRILRHAFLNSYYQTGLKNLIDIAIINASDSIKKSGDWKKYKKVDEIPFDFNRRRMSVVVQSESGKIQMITKGAVEEMLSICEYAEYNGEVKPITPEIKKEIKKRVKSYNEDGLRVIAVAQKSKDVSGVGVFSVKDESDMVLMGYLAFLDPPKESTSKAIDALNKHGVAVKVLTGDSEAVTRYVCAQVGMNVSQMVLGDDVDDCDDEQLKELVEKANIFAKLSPMQKARIVATLRSNGHTVGYMGDGINDAAAMKEADVSISVDTAVDIAKESADIILLEKDLMVLEQGIIEGRKTFGNIIKYIKMTASSNFGNMLSMLVASAFLPFLPMFPLQILTLNLIYNVSCIAVPWDNVDEEFLKLPRKWEASTISRFMLWIGPTSSVFDITTYVLMFFVICPSVMGGSYSQMQTPEQQAQFLALFQTGWFVESLWSQTLVIHMIRTPKIPFIQSRASYGVSFFTCLGIIVGTAIPFIKPIAKLLGMSALPAIYFAWLALIIVLYMGLATVAKKLYVRRYKELL